MGLDRELRQACVYRGLGPHIVEWYKVAVELDIGLKEFRTRGEVLGQPQKQLERLQMG